MADTLHERSPWSRGVLASYDPMTPTRSEDISKFKLTIRDALCLLAGALAMYGAAIAAQYGTRSDIRDLGTKFESYQQKQNDTNSSLQRQIDEWRAETKLNRVNTEETQKAIAELKGILLGAGIKGVQK